MDYESCLFDTIPCLPLSYKFKLKSLHSWLIKLKQINNETADNAKLYSFSPKYDITSSEQQY